MPTKTSASPNYGAYRERQAEISRDRSAAGREVGPLPPVVNKRRRERGRKSLLAFAQSYFPGRFFWPFSPAHRVAIAKMEECSGSGGRFALAMPRGSGKTAMAEIAALRAVLYGLRRYVVIVQATEPLAAKSLKKIQRELEANDLLAEDFPEVCHPIRSLERIHNRAKGQTLDNEPTRIEWTANGVTLPVVKGSKASGAILYVAGITGAVRGLSAVGPGGEVLRPDMVIIDDPQTRESAKSPSQTAEREAIVTDDILGLAGPGTEMAAVMLCTVIYPGDLSAKFLDRDRHPTWQGERTRMLESFPERMDLWDEYAETRRQSFREGDRGKRSAAFYAENRAEMDRGGVVSWPERMKDGELSGLQSAMNLYYDNPRGFRAEYQNDPEPPGGAAGVKEHDPRALVRRLSGVPRLCVPVEATRLTAMIDCGGKLHWYAVVAWDAGFGGSVIDYGTWPRQSRAMFARSDPRPSLADVYPRLSETQRAYAGLRDLTDEILGRTYRRDRGGEEMRVERCLIDAGWESQTVHQFCRQSPHAGVIYPSKGVGRTTLRTGVSEWRPRPGERAGPHWRLTTSVTERGRMVQFDPDAWKTWLWEMLTCEPGGRGYLSFYGSDSRAHEMISEHVAAESAEPVTIRGNSFDKWAVLPHNPDNDWLDTLVGCAVAASVQGLAWDSGAAAGDPAKPRERPKTVSYREMQQKARAGR